MKLAAIIYLQTVVLLKYAHSSSRENELGLLVLSPQPQPLLHPQFQPAFEEGPALYLAAELAAELANNSSNILPGYKIKLLQGDSGCNVPFRAIDSFVQPLLASKKRSVSVVGVIGPVCSLSSLSVSALSSRSELALINIHFSGTRRLNDRNRYPYAFGIYDSSELIARAMVAILHRANWSRSAVIYDISREYFSSIKNVFSEIVGAELSESNHSLVGISAINLLPFHKIQNSFRVVFLLVSTDLLNKLLCIAYHSGYFSPAYQYVLNVESLSSVSAVTFKYGSVSYICSRKQINQVLVGALLIDHQTGREDSKFLTSSGLSLERFYQLHQGRLDTEDMPASIDAIAFFDATWSLIMALNASSNSFNLSGFGFGQPAVTNVIRENLYALDFEGLLGRVRFNRTTGRFQQNATVSFVSEAGRIIQYAYYDRDQNFIVQMNLMAYIKDSFEFDVVTVPKPLLWTMVVLVFFGFLLTLTLNILTCIYRSESSVKASSLRLTQVAFIGCYVHAFSMMLAVLVYGFADVIKTETYCFIQHLHDFFVALGLTILFAAISVRMWRLYRIFVHFRNPGRYLSDFCLCTIVVMFVLFNLILTVPSFFIEDFKYIPKLNPHPTKKVNGHIPTVLNCEQQQILLWFMLSFMVSAILLLAIFILAVLTRKIALKNFRTKSIVLMSYTLGAVIPFCVALYIIFYSLDGGVHIILRFCTISVFLLCLISVPCTLLFFPPLLPVLKKAKEKFYFCS